MNNQPDRILEIDGRQIGESHPTYFIADIAANHDGDLGRAVELIHLAAAAGADAAKFQHFNAETIVSDIGFRALGERLSHQANWKKSVFEVYKEASVDIGWTSTLAEASKHAGISFFTSPYSMDLVDAIDTYVPAYKIESGDLTWIEIIEYIARKNKPCIIATGASTLDDVDRAVSAALAHNSQLALLQCNTNYTVSVENYRFIQLNVLKTYRDMYPSMVLGLSDHTAGHATVLGAVSLGARIVEKHFTDDANRTGPDHAFSMTPTTWSEMVDRTRELEAALGGGVKRIEDNERETAVLQRRSIRLRAALNAGSRVERQNVTLLRPCPPGSLLPYDLPSVIGRTLVRDMQEGEALKWSDIG